MVRRQGRPRRRRARRHRTARGDRHRRHRCAVVAQTRRRGLQPDVDRRRRAGAHPGGRGQRGGLGVVHHRTQPRRRARQAGTGMSAGRLDAVRLRSQSRLRRVVGHRGRHRLRPHRQDHHRRVRRHHALRLPRHRAPGRIRHRDRRSRPGADGVAGHGGVRRSRAVGRRLAGHRARRDHVCVRIRPDHRGSGDGVVDDPGRSRRRGVRQLAGNRRRQDRHRHQRAVEEGPDPGTGLATRRGRMEDHH